MKEFYSTSPRTVRGRPIPLRNRMKEGHKSFRGPSRTVTILIAELTKWLHMISPTKGKTVKKIFTAAERRADDVARQRTTIDTNQLWPEMQGWRLRFWIWTHAFIKGSVELSAESKSYLKRELVSHLAPLWQIRRLTHAGQPLSAR